MRRGGREQEKKLGKRLANLEKYCLIESSFKGPFEGTIEEVCKDK